MAKIKFFKTAGIILCAVLLFSSCSKTLFPSRKKSKKMMTMTTALTGRACIYMAGSGEATINWGDGMLSETHILVSQEENSTSLSGSKHLYCHYYSEATARTITITGENITHLRCNTNELTKLDVSKNSTLTGLYCWNNPLTELDVSKNSALKWLDCCDTPLTELNVSNNSELECLECWCALTELDVSKNSKLKRLYCRSSELTKLDVSKNSELIYLACSNNQLTELDVSKNNALIYLECMYNLFEAPALNALFGALPNNPDGEIYIGGNPGTDAACSDTSIPESKGWEVICGDD